MNFFVQKILYPSMDAHLKVFNFLQNERKSFSDSALAS